MVVPGTKLAAYFANLLKVGINSGYIPRLFRLHKAVAAGDISRREFFQRVALIRQEAKAQADLLAVGAEMESNRQKAALALRTNSKWVNKIDKSHAKAIDLAPKVQKRKIREDARKLLNKGPKEVNQQHMSRRHRMEGEWWWEGPRSPEDRRLYDSWKKIYQREMKENPRSLSRKAREVAEFNAGWGMENSKDTIERKILSRLLKKAGVTPEIGRKIRNLEELARQGYENMPNDPILKKWFAARKKLMAITKQGTVSMGDYTQKVSKHYNAQRSGGYDISEPVRHVKKVAKELTKHGESKIKSIWDGLSDEFKKGYHGIDEIK